MLALCETIPLLATLLEFVVESTNRPHSIELYAPDDEETKRELTATIADNSSQYHTSHYACVVEERIHDCIVEHRAPHELFDGFSVREGFHDG